LLDLAGEPLVHRGLQHGLDDARDVRARQRGQGEAHDLGVRLDAIQQDRVGGPARGDQHERCRRHAPQHQRQQGEGVVVDVVEVVDQQRRGARRGELGEQPHHPVARAPEPGPGVLSA
jgi:hypothetical protein